MTTPVGAGARPPTSTVPAAPSIPRSRRAGAFALIYLLVLVLAACSTASTSTDGDGTTPDDLTIATSFAIDDLLPLENGFWAPEFGYGDLLMKPLPGGELEPWVLESLEPLDETRWELTLREGVTFQNGNSLAAAGLAELMTWHLEHNTSVAPVLEGAVVEPTGPLTVELETTEPAPNVPSILGNEAAFVLFDLETYQELEDEPAELLAAGIYTGPYTVTSLTPDVMELAPTDGYYGEEPALSSLTVLFVPNEDARVRAVQSGEADLALYPPTAAARQLEGRDDAVFLAQPAGEGTGGMQLFVNQATGILDDRATRQALQRAMDYEALADEVMNGLYDRSPGLVPSALPYSIDTLATDVAEAEELLDEAGWERDGDGVRARDGEDLTLRLLTYPQQPDVAEVGVALQDQLGAVGIDLELVEVDDITEALEEPDGWELGISMNSLLGMTGTDPIYGAVAYLRSSGERNHGGIDDPDLDVLVDEVGVTPEESARGELLEEIQRLTVEEQAYTWWVAFRRTPVVASPDLEDYEVPVANLWVDPLT